MRKGVNLQLFTRLVYLTSLRQKNTTNQLPGSWSWSTIRPVASAHCGLSLRGRVVHGVHGKVLGGFINPVGAYNVGLSKHRPSPRKCQEEILKQEKLPKSTKKKQLTNPHVLYCFLLSGSSSLDLWYGWTPSTSKP